MPQDLLAFELAPNEKIAWSGRSRGVLRAIARAGSRDPLDSLSAPALLAVAGWLAWSDWKNHTNNSSWITIVCGVLAAFRVVALVKAIRLELDQRFAVTDQGRVLIQRGMLVESFALPGPDEIALDGDYGDPVADLVLGERILPAVASPAEAVDAIRAVATRPAPPT
jgi:hypothetical protein